MSRSPARDGPPPDGGLHLLDAIAEALSRETGVTQMLHRALDALARDLGLETGWVWLLDRETNQFYLAAERALPPFLQEPVQMTGEVCWCMESFLDGDFASKNVDVIACSRLRSAPSPALTGGLRHHASVVLRFGERELGIMNLTAPNRRPLVQDELRLLATIGAQIGLAIERARLSDETVSGARSEERTRMAREIHDTLAQDLTAIILQLEQALREQRAGEGRARIVRALDVAREALQRARTSLSNLHEDPLGGRPLSAALWALARRFASQTGILATVEGERAPSLSHAAEVELYRIAAEALSNVERHARARRVTVTLGTTDDDVVMRVDDDGVGYHGERAERRFGIVGMTQRGETVGGTVAVYAREQEGGTRVEARIPRLRS